MAVAGLVLGILGIVGGFIPVVNFVAWLSPLVGLILSAIALSKAKAAGQPAGVALAGLILSIIGLAFSLIGVICTVCVAGAAGAAALGL